MFVGKTDLTSTQLYMQVMTVVRLTVGISCLHISHICYVYAKNSAKLVGRVLATE